MALPAVYLLQKKFPQAEFIILAKSSVASLWRYVNGITEVIAFAPNEEKNAEEKIRSLAIDRAIIFPHSFRSAKMVWKGKVRKIRGISGQFRFLFVNDRVSIRDLTNAHQAREYFRIAGVEASEIPSPSLMLDKSRLPQITISADGALVILPGAARGSSKRWPPEYFAKVAMEALTAKPDLPILVCGTNGEKTECDKVYSLLEATNANVQNLCGKTSLFELVSLLSKAKVVLSNDSGGMHLATLTGTPVVAIFGITDPQKTGPLGTATVIQAEGVKASRAIPRESERATRALLSVTPKRVFDALKGYI